VSGQADLGTARWGASAAGDVSFVGELEGDLSSRQASESWLADGETRRGVSSLGVRAGYAPPAFLDQLELVSGGLSQGGVTVAARTGPWRLRLHRAVDPGLGAVAGAGFGPEQELQAGALELADGQGRYDLRLVGLEVEEAAGDFTSGGSGESVGLFARVAVGEAASLVVEGARGRFSPRDGAHAPDRGAAFRLGLQGLRGSLAYSVDLRRVEAGFVDPASGGLTPGGRPDRDSLDISLGRTAAASSLSLQLQHVRGGDSFAPGARSSTASLAWTRTLPAGSVTATAAWDRADGSADEELSLPPVRRTGWTLAVALDQSLGALQLSESLTYQARDDTFDPSGDADTVMAGLRATTTTASWLRLSAGLDGTQVDGGPFQGRSRSWTLSLQPVVDLPAAALAISPYVAYTDSATPLFGLDSATETARLHLTWSPPWRGSRLAVELGTDWSRMRDSSLPDSGIAHRYTLAVTVRWDAAGRMAATRPLTGSAGGAGWSLPEATGAEQVGPGGSLVSP
jgi:hypothetical protein